MPATTMSPPAQAKGKSSDRAPVLVVPFTRAAQEHLEPFVDTSQALGASAVQMGPFDVAAYGYLRGAYLTFDLTAGSGTATVALKEDAPWSLIQEISIIDVNGAPIIGPISGYDLYLLNKYGGYAGSSDPRKSPYFTALGTGANGTGNGKFVLRLPVEINARDALGSLPNQNAASTYKIRITLAQASDVFSTSPTNLPTVRVRAYLDAWSQPTSADLRGNAQAQVPPAVGTTQFASKQIMNLSSGQQTVRFSRVGNYWRNCILVVRATSDGTRATGAPLFPDPMTWYWDTRPTLQSVPRDLWRHIMQQRTDYYGTADAVNGLDTGVYVFDRMHEFDGKIGQELRDGWLGTVQSTRLEMQGSFGGAVALTALVNDVSPNGEIFV